MTTICAPATSFGGALSVIRVSGSDAISIVNSIFSKGIKDAPGYSVHYGEISPNTTSTRGEEIIDSVILTIFRAPHSYTGEDSVEISCHGSRYIIERLLHLLMDKGCRMANPGEFTLRAFQNGKMDLTQAEAVADLIASTNQATHTLALNQMRGGIRTKLHEMREELLKLTSLLELELDFSDHEDVEFANREELSTLSSRLSTEIEVLASSFQSGNAIKNGIPVAIIGAPNTGKSTLLNALVKEDRSIVSDIQGTTRDLIEDTIQIEGITFRFIDTAGLHKTTDKIELMGIERSIEAARKAQIVILLTTQGQPFPDFEEYGTPQADSKPKVIHVINKCDLFLPDSSYLYHRDIKKDQDIHISSLTGAGMQQLTDALVYSAQVPHISHGDIVITNARHYESLCRALEDIRRVQNGLTDNIPSDLVAEDLRQCLTHLGEITGGTITSDEVLHNIFSHFCIGK